MIVGLTAIILVILIVIGVRTLGERNETSTVDASDAKALIEDGSSKDKANKRQNDIKVGLRPRPGTYTYVGSGNESVDILGGSEHILPDTFPMVIDIDKKDSCAWNANLVYIKQHIEQRSFCTTDASVLELSFMREIEFFGRKQKVEYRCGDDAFRVRADANPGEKWSWVCNAKNENSKSAFFLTYLGPQTLVIASKKVRTQHTRIISTQTGDTVGNATSDLWLSPSGMIVRFNENVKVRTKTVLGVTNFQERARYQIKSLEPESD